MRRRVTAARSSWQRENCAALAPAGAALARPTSRLPADPRAALAAIAQQHGHSLAALSRMLRRRDRYLDGFVREGIPPALTAADHRLLADHFGVTERALGIRDLWVDA